MMYDKSGQFFHSLYLCLIRQENHNNYFLFNTITDPWCHVNNYIVRSYRLVIISVVTSSVTRRTIKADYSHVLKYKKIAHWADEVSTDAFGEMLSKNCKFS